MARDAASGDPRAMEAWSAIGRVLVGVGLAIALVGAWLWLGAPGPAFGRLPGDLRIERPGLRLYLPITTSLLLSLALSAAWWLLSRLR